MLRFLIVFLFCGFKLLSQDADTLLGTILRNENDTDRVNQLYKQGFDLVDKNPQLAYIYAQNCEIAAKKSKSLKHISKSDNLLGILFYHQGFYKKSLVYFENYLSANKALNNVLGIGFGNTNLGNTYLQLEQFDKAERYYLLAIENYNALNNKTEVANGLINLGVLKHEQGQLEAASENYQKALQTGKELNDYGIKAICLNNLAQVYSDQGDYEKALAYNYDALEIRDLMGLDVDVSDSYLSIAEVSLKQKNLVLAEENLDLAFELCTKLEYYEGKMTYHQLAAELYSQKNNYQLAYENLKIYNQLNDSLELMQDIEPVLDFKESIEVTHIQTKNQVKNMWLLGLLSLILIIIPFVLIRYKR
jgi:tetratricopeptide (TPR) repeat protein